MNDRVADTRFHQIDRDSIAVYDAVTQRVHALHLSVNEGRIEVADLWAVSVSDTSDSGADGVFPAVGFAATKEGAVTVVRPIVAHDRARMFVARYTPRGRERFWLSDSFWRAAIVSPVEARGIIIRDTPWEERVSLAE